MAVTLTSTGNRKISVVTSPQWFTVFLSIAFIFSFVPMLIGYYLGLTVASDTVFGFYALLSGLFADAVLRWRLNISLVLFQRVQIPFIGFWIFVCLYVMIINPL